MALLEDHFEPWQIEKIEVLMRTHNLTEGQAIDLYKDKLRFEKKRAERRNGT